MIRVAILQTEGNEDLPLPEQKSAGASGFDLHAAIKAEWVIEPGQSKLIPTGISLAMPHNLEAQVRPRSGLALKAGITVLNTPGTIDADYRGEIGVILINHSKEPFHIQRGDRIAQLVFQELPQVELQQVDRLETTTRGLGGFGHTGK